MPQDVRRSSSQDARGSWSHRSRTSPGCTTYTLRCGLNRAPLCIPGTTAERLRFAGFHRGKRRTLRHRRSTAARRPVLARDAMSTSSVGSGSRDEHGQCRRLEYTRACGISTRGHDYPIARIRHSRPNSSGKQAQRPPPLGARVPCKQGREGSRVRPDAGDKATWPQSPGLHSISPMLRWSWVFGLRRSGTNGVGPKSRTRRRYTRSRPGHSRYRAPSRRPTGPDARSTRSDCTLNTKSSVEGTARCYTTRSRTNRP